MGAGATALVEAEPNEAMGVSTTGVGDSSGPASFLRRHWVFLAVVGAFVGSAFIVPTLAPVSVSDDGQYARSVQTLLRDGRLEILPLSAVTQLTQLAWGALFGSILGDSLGVLRVSTVVLTLLGGWGCYGLCRQLGVSRDRSALGTAAYLFNPLSYVLSFTFMTDAALTALLVIAAYCYARGILGDTLRHRWLVIGSVACTAAFLVRQQGILIAVGVACFLVASRRVRPDTAGVRTLAGVAAIPMLAAVGFYVWGTVFGGLPENDAHSFVAGQLWALPTSGELLRTLVFVEAIYPGFFALPVALAAVGALISLLRSTRGVTWAVLAVWATVVGVGLAAYTIAMPYLPAFFTSTGLGPGGDLRGGRTVLFGRGVRVTFTALCVLAMLVVLLAVCRRQAHDRCPAGSRARLVLWIALLQGAAVFATSVTLRNDPAMSRDRYLLPLLPLVICLALWALRDVALWRPVAWGTVAAFAAYSVAGTHDHLSAQAATWELADEAHADGVPYARLDAGAAWAAYHVYERFGGWNDVPPSVLRASAPAPEAEKAPGPAPTPPPASGPVVLSPNDVPDWWVSFYAPATTAADYVVSSEPLIGHTVVDRREHSSWLRSDPTYVYLLRRDASVPAHDR